MPATDAAKGAHIISMESRLRQGAQPRLTVQRRSSCFDHYYEIDRKTQLATCSKCGETFSAYQVLVDLAEHWGDFHGNRQAIKKEIDTLRKQEAELKAEVDRLKAFVRRRLRSIAESSPHATRALELVLRIHRLRSHNPYSGDRIALFELVRQVEKDAQVVGIDRSGLEPKSGDAS